VAILIQNNYKTVQSAEEVEINLNYSRKKESSNLNS